MSLFYALIAKNYDLILSEFTDYSGNFQQITRMLLYKLKNSSFGENNNINYKSNIIYHIQYDKYRYYYLIEDNIIYLCMSFIDNENNSSAGLIIAFLQDLKKFFLAQYSKYEIEHFKSYEINDFHGTIQSLIDYYNNKPNITKSGLLISQTIIEDLRDININKFFDNDEIINIIVENDTYNTITVLKKNIVLSDYINKKEKIENLKTFGKILIVIFLFILLMCFLFYKFGNTEAVTAD